MKRLKILRMAVLVFMVGLFSSRGVRATELWSPSRSKGESLAIVVNRANPVDNLSTEDLRRLFLGRKTRWPNGRRIAIAMLDNHYPERHAVLRQIYHMDESEYEEYFIKATFRGEVFIAPRTLVSRDLVRKFIFNAPGAIGYLRASDVDDTVKVVRIDGHLPADTNYSLQIDEPKED